MASKKHTALFAALLALTGCVVAQTNISIKGTASNAAGKTVVLGGYTDRISFAEVELDKVNIGTDQRFELRCYANYPRLVYIQIENYSQSFYVIPGGDYEVSIPTFQWEQDEVVNVLLNPVTLPLEFLKLPPDDVNAEISRFDMVVANYLSSHAEHIDERYRPQKRYFDTLLAVVDNACPNTQNEFFNRYKRYHLAQLRMDTKFASRGKTYDIYLRNQPVLPYDDNYMSLFVSIYGRFISKGTRKISTHELQRWVANEDNEAFIDALGAEPLLRHEQIRELAALLALKEMYYDEKHYEGRHVLNMISYIGSHTKFADHKPIVNNLLSNLRRAEVGSTAKEFVLPNADKNMVSLSSFKGKWVYLSFVRVGEPASLGELETLAFFKDTIYAQDQNVEFVTIDCDREFQTMFHFLKNSKRGDLYSWTWLHFNGNYDLLRSYQAVTFPTFVLLNPNGELCYDVTPAPSSGFLLSPPWRQKKRIEGESGSFLRQ
ncbi:MAG: redoxin domain-containing protein [Bacteroidales bacterium]|nr:redoxin domain-containing protein [Bacteroidales bacterium]